MEQAASSLLSAILNKADLSHLVLFAAIGLMSYLFLQERKGRVMDSERYSGSVDKLGASMDRLTNVISELKGKVER